MYKTGGSGVLDDTNTPTNTHKRVSELCFMSYVMIVYVLLLHYDFSPWLKACSLRRPHQAHGGSSFEAVDSRPFLETTAPIAALTDSRVSRESGTDIP